MNPSAYIQMAQTEATHWWFCGRRAISAKIIKALNLPKNSNILEVGCGTGGNLALLSEFGKVSAFEMDAIARDIASNKCGNLCEIADGSCPNCIPFQDQRFDLICMFDVMEHIEEDTETLIALKQLLAKNGRILITIPANQWLYGAHDEFLHHKRRYSATMLRNKITTAGLSPIKISYFNTILFPLAVIIRLKDKLFTTRSASGTNTPPTFINKLLKSLFQSERFLLERFNLPFGVSLLCILKSSNK